MDIRCYDHYQYVTPLGSFKTVFLSNQECGEIDPAFVRKFMHDLPRKWKIMNYNYLEHHVSFNKDDTYPLMTYGWTEMKELFDFNDKQLLHFSYFGDGLFGLRVSTYHNLTEIPKFHSRYLNENIDGVFCVRLSEDTVNKPYLSIWCQFEEFVRSKNINSFTAYNDNGSKTVFDIAMTDTPFNTTAIGLDWMEFCTWNQFQPGDIICFKFHEDLDAEIAVRVYKWEV